jgi:hypothetical protein
VAVGLDYAEKSDWSKAMKAYKHALEIDSDCIEAMVGKWTPLPLFGLN